MEDGKRKMEDEKRREPEDWKMQKFSGAREKYLRV